jgi:hypothetical protein
MHERMEDVIPAELQSNSPSSILFSQTPNSLALIADAGAWQTHCSSSTIRLSFAASSLTGGLPIRLRAAFCLHCCLRFFTLTCS